MRTTTKQTLCSALLVLALGVNARAAQITILSVTGNWHDATATGTGSGAPTTVNGTPTSKISWGTQTPQSGYDFTRTIPGVQTLPPAPTPLFPLGTFTHHNHTASPSITSVFLDVVLQLNVDGTATQPLTFTFKFNHDETANLSNISQCDQTKMNTNPPSTVPCPDVVTFAASPSPTTFNVGGVNYTLSMSFVDTAGHPVARFVTEEGLENVANLVAQFNTPATGGGTNTAPIANAGPNQTITLPSQATMAGTVTDDGLPNNILTVLWTKVNGPAGGNVTFQDDKALGTTVSFSAAGTYVLRLTANDTLLTASSDVTILVNPSGPVCTPNNACQANTCSGSSCQDTCGTTYSGTKDCSVTPLPPPCVPDNSCQLATCSGGTCQDSCNISYTGTKSCPTVPPPPPPFVPVVSKVIIKPVGYLQILSGNIFVVHAGTTTITKTVYDQLNHVMPAEIVDWKATSGVMSPAGALTAPTPMDLIQVTARSKSNPSIVSDPVYLRVIDPKSSFAGDISNAIAYPVPWKAGMAKQITFDHMAANTTIRIFTATGRLVTKIFTNNIQFPWLLTNDNGENVASGVYFYIIDNGDSNQRVKGKLVIIK